MKSLQEIQNEVAKDHGWENYEIVLKYFHDGIISKYSFLDIMDDLVHEVAKQALINASENAKAESVGFSEAVYFCSCSYQVDKQSILNESNIPTL